MTREQALLELRLILTDALLVYLLLGGLFLVLSLVHYHFVSKKAWERYQSQRVKPRQCSHHPSWDDCPDCSELTGHAGLPTKEAV